MKKKILYLVSLLAASLFVLPAVAQSESVVTLSANGYVTAAPEKNAFIDEQRCDYRGGVEGEGFFLTMGGFFDDYLKSGTRFERTGNVTEAPDIDFSTLE